MALLLIVATGAVLGGWEIAKRMEPGTPPLTKLAALDIFRQEASNRDETLTKFNIVAANGPYVRAIVAIPEEAVGSLPVDITYEYGWHLLRIEPVKGKVPGPG